MARKSKIKTGPSASKFRETEFYINAQCFSVKYKKSIPTHRISGPSDNRLILSKWFCFGVSSALAGTSFYFKKQKRNQILNTFFRNLSVSRPIAILIAWKLSKKLTPVNGDYNETIHKRAGLGDRYRFWNLKKKPPSESRYKYFLLGTGRVEDICRQSFPVRYNLFRALTLL